MSSVTRTELVRVLGEVGGNVIADQIAGLNENAVTRAQFTSELRGQALKYWGVSAVVFGLMLAGALYIADQKPCDCAVTLDGYVLSPKPD